MQLTGEIWEQLGYSQIEETDEYVVWQHERVLPDFEVKPETYDERPQGIYLASCPANRIQIKVYKTGKDKTLLNPKTLSDVANITFLLCKLSYEKLGRTSIVAQFRNLLEIE